MRKLLIALLVLLLAFSAAPTKADSTNKPQPKGLRNDLIVNGARVYNLTPSPYMGFHFPRGSGAQTYVRVVYASSDTRWLATTKTAVANWNKSSRIAMVMASSCPTWKPQRNCVFVRVVNDGNNGILGTAVIWANDHVVSPLTFVKFNSYYSGSRTSANLPCHELGHTLGLGHPLDGSQGPCVGVPKQEDYDLIRKVYRHTDGAGYPPGVG